MTSPYKNWSNDKLLKHLALGQVRVADVVPATRAFSLHQMGVTTRGGIMKLADSKAQSVLPGGRPLDINWLKAASETFVISSDPRDYVIWEIPIVTADYPNRNMDAFPYTELTYFSPIYGRMGYRTLVGKGLHVNHKNQDPTKAKGVIFDATLRKIGGVYHVVELAGFDRTKDVDLVNEMIKSPVNKFSMGALVSFTTCSICGFKSTGNQFCIDHIGPRGVKKGQIFNGQIAYELCRLINFIETSRVESPADVNASTELKMNLEYLRFVSGRVKPQFNL